MLIKKYFPKKNKQTKKNSAKVQFYIHIFVFSSVIRNSTQNKVYTPPLYTLWDQATFIVFLNPKDPFLLLLS